VWHVKDWHEVHLDTDDGGVVEAYWHRGQKGSVLLAHGRIYDAESFRAYGDHLADAGYGVLRINFRTYHGSSLGALGPDARYEDVLGAAHWIRAETGAPLVALGASMGGEAVFNAASREPTAFAALVGWSPMPLPAAAARSLRTPKLVVWSQTEGAAGLVAEFFSNLGEPKEHHVFPGEAHAQQLLQGPHAEELVRRVDAFLGRFL
jgi:alpha-beta hydrolase superfamily lysophospholipase